MGPEAATRSIETTQVPRRARLRRGTALVLSLGLLAGSVGGCAEKAPETIPPVAGDTCGIYRTAMNNQGKTVEDATFASAGKAVIAALGGAGLAIILGGDRTTALITAGAIFAGVFVYDQLNQPAQASLLRMAVYDQADLVAESAAEAQRAFNLLAECRRGQVREARALPRQAGDARLAELRVWYRDDVTSAKAINASLRTRVAELEEKTRKVDANALQAETQRPPASFAAVARRDATLHAQPSATAASVGSVSSGQAVRATARRGDWVQVSSGGRTGWVSETALIRETPPQRLTAQRPERIWSQPGAEGRDLGGVGQGTTQTATARVPGSIAIDLRQQQQQRGFVAATAFGSTAPAGAEEQALVQATATAVRKRDALERQVAQAEAETL